MHQSNGYAIPLAQQPRVPRPIQNILATGEDESGRLFYETPPSQCWLRYCRVEH